MPPQADPTTTPPEAPGQSFVGHLLELRSRLLRAVVAVLLVFFLLSPFANQAYAWLAAPLISALPDNTHMIATGVAAPFLTPFKLTLVLSLFVALPYVLYQIWAFIAPGLYAMEKRLAVPLLVSSTLLFYLGAAFAYFVVFPLIFGFFTRVVPEGVSMMTDISAYLDFVLILFLAFGMAFEVPIATILLVRFGIVDAQSLAAKRPYFIVGALVVGMLLTPPDVVSQLLLAIPIWILFELGLVLSRWFKPPVDDTDEN